MSQKRSVLREKWRQIVAEQRAGGGTAAAFCRERGIPEKSFYAWSRRLRAAPAVAADRSALAFVEVKRSVVPAGEAIEICLPGERRLRVRRGFDRDLLIGLVQVLESLPSKAEGIA